MLRSPVCSLTVAGLKDYQEMLLISEKRYCRCVKPLLGPQGFLAGGWLQPFLTVTLPDLVVG